MDKFCKSDPVSTALCPVNLKSVLTESFWKLFADVNRFEG